jgi:hypothetical protein
MITRREFVICVAGATVASAFADQKSDEKLNVKLIAPCGLYCGACPMYIATQSKDEAKIKGVMKQFGQANAPIEDMLCDGCIGGGRVAAFCRKCEITSCAAKKSPKTKVCADCPDLGCERITKFNNDGMLHHAEALPNLRQAGAMGLDKWVKLEKEKWSCPKCAAPIAWYDPACPKCGEKRSSRLFPLRKA